MFGRKIQVDLVKDKKVAPDGPRESFSEKIGVTAYYLEKVVKKVAVGVVAYVAIDTVRKVMIEQAKHPRV